MIISINIPDEVKNEVIDAICDEYGYVAETMGVKNLETKAQFAKRQIIEFVKNITKTYRVNKAVEEAKQIEQVEINIT